MPIEMDYKALSFWWNFLQTFLLLIVAIYSWVVSRHQANKSAVDELGDRVLVLEERSKAGPTHDDIARIDKSIAEVAQAMATMDGTLSQMNSTLQLINNFMLRSN